MYVLEAPQKVELAASASSSRINAGDTAVLHVQRWTAGVWKRIRMRELSPGRCWMRRPPPKFEAEVADNVNWQVAPTTSARFSAFRPDHTRLVLLPDTGVFTLTASTSVWCEPGRSVAEQSLKIQVTPR